MTRYLRLTLYLIGLTAAVLLGAYGLMTWAEAVIPQVEAPR